MRLCVARSTGNPDLLLRYLGGQQSVWVCPSNRTLFDSALYPAPDGTASGTPWASTARS